MQDIYTSTRPDINLLNGTEQEIKEQLKKAIKPNLTEKSTYDIEAIFRRFIEFGYIVKVINTNAPTKPDNNNTKPNGK